MSEQQAEGPVSKLFCAADADLILRSCDGGIFKVHRKNLELHSEGFSAAEAASRSSSSEDAETVTVSLTESAAILELLLQYMYRQPQPDLQNTDFKTLAEVAEAAEKYQVYSATYVCKILMELKIPQHPLDVLNYAAKHGYNKVADVAARQTVGETVEDALKVLSPPYFIAWVRYNQGWQDVLLYAYRRRCINGHVPYNSRSIECEYWMKIWGIICSKLDGRLESLRNLEGIVTDCREGTLCGYCDKDLSEWQDDIKKRMGEIAAFSTFL